MFTVTESSIALGERKGTRKWFARLIGTGAGNSGVHTEEALKSTGASAWPIGTKINVDHASWREQDERPEGSLKSVAGIIASTPEYLDESDVPGLYAEVQFGEGWGPFVEEFKDVIGLSIHADGWGDEINENGLRIIEGYIPSPLNTVDLVTVAGAKGKIIEALESLQPKSDTIENETKPTGEETGMTDEDIQKIVEALKPMLSELREALTPKEPEVVEEEVDIASVVEAITAEDIPAPVRSRVVEAFKADSKINLEDVIASEKAYAESLVKEAVDASPGVIRGSASSTVEPSRLTVKGLN